jgi:hypothetical protein
MTKTIWFNKYLSNTWEVLTLLRKARMPNEFRVLCTHSKQHYPGRHSSDLFEQEPDGLTEDAYVAYCLDVSRRHRVEIFMPGRNVLPIVRARGAFASLGVRVLAAADVKTIALINHKAHFYAALKGLDIQVPAYELVNDLAGFDAAWDRLRSTTDVLCYKPAISVYGLGFQIVADHDPPRLQNDPAFLRLDEARRRLRAKGRFRDLLVMPYLPGPERSVDCLANEGKLIRAVVRRKEEKGQTLERNPALVAAVRRLTAHFGLTNLFNVQFRDADGVSYLLEVNPRMSGGLPFACQSGVVFPYWALRLALGTCTPSDIPEPCTGIWIPQPEPVSSL